MIRADLIQVCFFRRYVQYHLVVYRKDDRIAGHLQP